MTYAKASETSKVSVKQVYAIAHLLVEAKGLPWPQNAKEASTMIGELKAEQEQQPA